MNEFIEDLEELRDTYKSGEMMSLKESVSGQVAVESILEKANELNRNQYLSEMGKISRVWLHLRQLDEGPEKLGYQIYEDIDEVIEKYIPHKSLAKRRNQTNKKTN